MGFAWMSVADGPASYNAAKQRVEYRVFACYERVLDEQEIFRYMAGEGDFSNASVMTVYLTVSGLLVSRKAFKFNDVSKQKIIEWE
jgi:hypothetical protein